MRKKGYKKRCEKLTIAECEGACRTYDVARASYADMLQESAEVKEIRCSILLDGLAEGEYMTDFVCIKSRRFNGA